VTIVAERPHDEGGCFAWLCLAAFAMPLGAETPFDAKPSYIITIETVVSPALKMRKDCSLPTQTPAGRPGFSLSSPDQLPE